MENASKALLIAGGVLITMIIASFGVYLYGVYHSHAENVMNRLTESQITEFNAKFLAFEGRDLTANEVVSILNLVVECNKNNEINKQKITVEFNNVGQQYDIVAAAKTYKLNEVNNLTGEITDSIQKKWEKFITDCIGKNLKCRISQYNGGIVSKLEIMSP